MVEDTIRVSLHRSLDTHSGDYFNLKKFTLQFIKIFCIARLCSKQYCSKTGKTKTDEIKTDQTPRSDETSRERNRRTPSVKKTLHRAMSFANLLNKQLSSERMAHRQQQQQQQKHSRRQQQVLELLYYVFFKFYFWLPFSHQTWFICFLIRYA